MMRSEGALSRGGFSTICVTENRPPLRSPMPTTPYMCRRSAGIFSTAMIFGLSPRSRAASIICARQPRLCCTSTSGSSSANGSWPTNSRAHHTAWPSPRGNCCRVKLAVPGPGRSRGDAPLSLRERVFELELAVEMVLDDGLVAASDEDEMLDAGLARLVDHMLNQRPVDHRQHLLRHGLGGRQEPGAQPGDRENGFADRFHAFTGIVVVTLVASICLGIAEVWACNDSWNAGAKAIKS